MLEALGNLGDFIGGLAVVVTLLYLITQLRQHTEALRLEARQKIAEGMRAHMRLRSDPDTGRAFTAGLTSYPDMPFEDGYRFSNIAGDLGLLIQQAWALHESGALEDETYEAYLRFFIATIATPGGGRWWNDLARPIFIRRMVDAMDARLAQGTDIDFLAMQQNPRPAGPGERPATEAG